VDRWAGNNEEKGGGEGESVRTRKTEGRRRGHKSARPANSRERARSSAQEAAKTYLQELTKHALLILYKTLPCHTLRQRSL
jgi:hypothetical protein